MKDLAQSTLPLGQPETAIRPVRPAALWKKQLVVVALLVATRFLGVYGFRSDQTVQNKPISLSLPSTISGWKGKDIQVDPFVYTELHPNAVLQKRYTLMTPGNPKATEVNGKPKNNAPQAEVLVMYSRDTYGFHPPEVCLQVQGWVIAHSEVRQVTSKDGNLALTSLPRSSMTRPTVSLFFHRFQRSDFGASRGFCQHGSGSFSSSQCGDARNAIRLWQGRSSARW